MSEKKEKKTIPVWGNGPVIERVKIRPEQAVLACCTANFNGQSMVRMNGGGTLCHRGVTGTPPDGCFGASGGKDAACGALSTAGEESGSVSS